MFKKLVSFVLVLGMGFSLANGQEGLIGHWRFDESSGTVAAIDSASMTMRLYQDGRLVAEGPTPTLPSDLGETTENFLGRSQYAADSYYFGSLDEFRIYDKALSVEEVLFLAGK